MPSRPSRTSAFEIEEASGELLGFVQSIATDRGNLDFDEPLTRCLARVIATGAPTPRGQPRYSGTLRVTFAP